MPARVGTGFLLVQSSSRLVESLRPEPKSYHSLLSVDALPIQLTNKQVWAASFRIDEPLELRRAGPGALHHPGMGRAEVDEIPLHAARLA